MKKNTDNDRKKVTVQLSREDYELVRLVAFETRNSVSSLMRLILRQGLHILKEEGYSALGLQKDNYVDKIKKNIKKGGR